MTTGDILTLDVEKPAAGGYMVARADGRVVLVTGAIPGERVRARVQRVGKGVAFADVVEVIDPSADRRAVDVDWRCGGQALAHVRYERQLHLKGEIIADAFSRIGKIALAAPPAVLGSPERGYRVRARLHAAGGRLGFFREGTHEVCDAGCSGQLSEEALRWIGAATHVLDLAAVQALAEVELAESLDGSRRACHLRLRIGAEPARYAGVVEGLGGLSAEVAGRAQTTVIAGTPLLVDTLEGLGSTPLRLERDPRAFFQGNRFLVRPLVDTVLAAAGAGSILDLYAGVGLFGLALAAHGCEHVTLVEGDPISGADLERNARPYAPRARAVGQDVESFLKRQVSAPTRFDTVIVDPPRTGLSKEAAVGVAGIGARTIVYVSCDVATLARDTRVLLDAGYELERVDGLDLFPNTAHVESVVVLRRRT